MCTAFQIETYGIFRVEFIEVGAIPMLIGLAILSEGHVLLSRLFHEK